MGNSINHLELLRSIDNNTFLENIKKIYCPFIVLPPNPDCDDILAQSIAWLEKLGVADKNYDYKPMLAYMKLSAPSTFNEEQLRLYSDWFLLTNFVDEVIGESIENINHMQIIVDAFSKALKGRPANLPQINNLPQAKLSLVNNTINAINDFHSNLSKFPGNKKYFMNNCILQLRSLIVENHLRNSNSINSSLIDYMDLRASSIGMIYMAEILAIIANIHPSNKARNSFAFSMLRRISARHCGAMNDIFSLKKDLRDGDIGNIVLAIHKAHNLSDINEAITSAIEYTNNMIHTFLTLKELLAEDKVSLQFIAILEMIMSVNIKALMMSKRYQ
jgi:hypothetical protein